jgi:hypothetical protein
VHRCETHDQAVTRFAQLTGTDEAEVLASIALEAEIGSALEIDWEFEGLIG